MTSQLSLREKSSMRVSNGSKAGLFRHGQPTAHLGGSVKSFCGISLSKATAVGFGSLAAANFSYAIAGPFPKRSADHSL
jgi:hypothetical protein